MRKFTRQQRSLALSLAVAYEAVWSILRKPNSERYRDDWSQLRTYSRSLLEAQGGTGVKLHSEELIHYWISQADQAIERIDKFARGEDPDKAETAP